jgi:hypothetical protein
MVAFSMAYAEPRVLERSRVRHEQTASGLKTERTAATNLKARLTDEESRGVADRRHDQ